MLVDALAGRVSHVAVIPNWMLSHLETTELKYLNESVTNSHNNDMTRHVAF